MSCEPLVARSLYRMPLVCCRTVQSPPSSSVPVMDMRSLNRLSHVYNHIAPTTRHLTICVNETSTSDTVTIIDNRTGKKIDVPITSGTIPAKELLKFDLRSYDPGYFNTAVASSKITYIDGENGILRHRGYAIEDLVGKATFLEVAYLLIHGDLPSSQQYSRWQRRVQTHTYIHENLATLLKNFRYDAHPMGMVISAMAALSTFYPEANPALAGGEGVYNNPKMRNKQIYRILGKLPTIAACAYRHRIGRPYNYPNSELGYVENFLYMMDHLQEKDYKPHPKLVEALNALFILHADHELNCSTAAMRHVASASTDPYTAVAAAASALYGPLHGGANEAVLRMLEDIGTVESIPQFLADVKARRRKLMGFGHRVYKNYDPRARLIKNLAYDVFEVCGSEPLVEVAVALEKAALADDYFVKRKLFPNVDFYSGLIYKAMGFPTDMFPVLFCIPRAVGWLAHWVELLDDKEKRIVRPRQIYTGDMECSFVAMKDRRGVKTAVTHKPYYSASSKRRAVSLGDQEASP